jgi:hypothetical protein
MSGAFAEGRSRALVREEPVFASPTFEDVEAGARADQVVTAAAAKPVVAALDEKISASEEPSMISRRLVPLKVAILVFLC